MIIKRNKKDGELMLPSDVMKIANYIIDAVEERELESEIKRVYNRNC